MTPKRPIKLVDTLAPSVRHAAKRKCKRCGYDISSLERCPECGWHWRRSILYLLSGFKAPKEETQHHPRQFVHSEEGKT
jgi:predicted Zn-ribbon and HTH transcriptional regulator